jgi:sRNA-binding protein
MTGWWIMIWGCTCAAGALVLLTLASHEVQRIELVMAAFDRAEERDARRRRKRREKEAAERAEKEAAALDEPNAENTAPVVVRGLRPPGSVAVPVARG